MSGTYSKEEVQSHNKPDNLWLIVDDDVYDMTKFQVMQNDPNRGRLGPLADTSLIRRSTPEARRSSNE
jgi:hypothetical protein